MIRNENRELREERARVVSEMKKIADGGLKSNDERAQFGRLEADAKRLGERIDLIERAEERYLETRKTGAPPNPQPGDGFTGPTEDYDRVYKKAYAGYLRYGLSGISLDDAALVKSRRAKEYRDMQETTTPGAYGAGGSGGFFVPVGFVRKIEDALRYYGPFLNGGDGYPTIMTTATGSPLPYPTANDTAVTAELIGEGQQVTEDDVSIGQILFGAWKLSSKMCRVSLELLEDSAFDLEDFLIKEFAKRIGRGVNSFCTNGTGNQQPNGLVTAVLSSGPITTAVGSASNDSVGGPNSIGSDDLVRLEHSVDPLYRPNASYMCHDSTISALRQVKDKYGRPLWQPSLQDGQPGSVNGYRLLSNPYMSTLQSQASSPQVTNTTMLFGALDKYVIRRVRDISVLRLGERFADFGQVAYIAFYRFDAQLLDAGTHPIGALQNVY
jgi:HK97 family phage major capsid protein